MNIGFRKRVYLLVALFAVGCVTLAATLTWMQEQRARDDRARELKVLVQSAIGVLDAHQALAERGTMTEDAAKARALDIVSAMHPKDEELSIWGMSAEVPNLASGSATGPARGAPQRHSG